MLGKQMMEYSISLVLMPPRFIYYHHKVIMHSCIIYSYNNILFENEIDYLLSNKVLLSSLKINS